MEGSSVIKSTMVPIYRMISVHGAQRDSTYFCHSLFTLLPSGSDVSTAVPPNNRAAYFLRLWESRIPDFKHSSGSKIIWSCTSHNATQQQSIIRLSQSHKQPHLPALKYRRRINDFKDSFMSFLLWKGEFLHNLIPLFCQSTATYGAMASIQTE